MHNKRKNMKNLKVAFFLLISGIITSQITPTSYDNSGLIFTELNAYKALNKLKRTFNIKFSYKEEKKLLTLFKEGRTEIIGTDFETVKNQILNGDYSCFITKYKNKYKEKKQKELKKELDKLQKEIDEDEEFEKKQKRMAKAYKGKSKTTAPTKLLIFANFNL